MESCLATRALCEPHILEAVFSNLPVEDLHNVLLVCKHWNNIAGRKTFLRRRKSYHRYAKKRFSKEEEDALEAEVMSDLLSAAELSARSEEEKTMLLFFVGPSAGSLLKDHIAAERAGTYRGVRRHTGYHLVKAMTPFDGADSSAVLLLCLVEDDFDRFQELLWCLHSHEPALGRVACSELLYHVATILLVLERRKMLPARQHFFLAHALELSLNSPPSEGAALTLEQRRVANWPIDPRSESVVRVIAGAGTGKTTTLRHLCVNNPHLNFLLIVFNKSVQEHSQRVFPPNVECRTANSLAWRYCVHTLGYDRRRIRFRSIIADILSSNYMESRQGCGNIMTRCAQVQATIHNFCHSTSADLRMEHVPEQWTHREKSGLTVVTTIPPASRDALLQDATAVWTHGVAKAEEKSFPLVGACTVKLMQLGGIRLADIPDQKPFDVVLLDEGQDLNPAMLDVCLKQPVPKFIVGDPFQQIYSFNGAVNGLLKAQDYCVVAKTFRLTKSFRFGPEIALAATMCIRHLHNDSDVSINYNPLNANLQGARNGVFRFTILDYEVPGSI